MLVEVHLLRLQGRRLPWRDIENSRAYRGALRSIGVRGVARPTEVRLITAGGTAKHLLPPLYEPSFDGVSSDAFFIRGIERLELPEGVCAVVQEWRCRPIQSMDILERLT